MEFIHDKIYPEETIAAIATPPGEGGVAIIRISGKSALGVAQKIWSGNIYTYATHTAHFGKVLDHEGKTLDSALLLVFLGNRSYTGETVVEIHCHGGSLISRKILNLVLKSGARAARAGEFTLKAFLNGKMDLSQAEAVQELISAKNEKALLAAESQLEGRLSQKIGEFKRNLSGLAAILEAWVDFPEEGLEFMSFQEMEESLSAVLKEMKKLKSSFHDGKIFKEGIKLSLIGAPNVGKSSLMNSLLEKERAIVSPIPGTTRDVLEESLRIGGLHFQLTDTAGIRETEELVEQEGIKRSKRAMEEADLIILVVDAIKPLDQTDHLILQSIPKEKTVVALNKMDLKPESPPSLPFPFVVPLSAKTKEGIDDLKETINKIIWKKGPPSQEEVVITNIRHEEALSQAIIYSENVLQGLLSNVSPEFLASDMREALFYLGKILGTNITEDILNEIFSKFCVGK